MKAYGEWRYSSTILDLDIRYEVSGQLHAPITGWVGPIASLPLPGIRSVVQAIAQLLHQLSYITCF
jgi:hypothetical protein